MAVSVIICPPPEPQPPMSESARASAEYVLAMAHAGRLSMEDTTQLRLVQRYLRETGTQP